MAETNPLGAAGALEDKFQGLYDGLSAAEPAPAPEAPQGVTAAPAEPAGQEEPEAPVYESLEDYLAKSNMDVDSFYSLPTKVKVDGKEMEVSLKDLRKSYGLEQHIQAKSISLAEAQKAWEAEREAAKAQYTNQLKTAKDLADLAHRQLLSEYQNVNWNELRVRDPQQWLLLDREFNNRANQIQGALQQIAQAEREKQEAQLKEQEKLVSVERERMLERNPDWRDDTKFSAARDAIGKYARSLGFTTAELGSIFDHRYMQVLHDAARFAALQAQAPQKLKQVRAAPQVSNAGARVTRDPKADALKTSRDSFLKNPRSQEAQTRYFDQLAGTLP